MISIQVKAIISLIALAFTMFVISTDQITNTAVWLALRLASIFITALLFYHTYKYRGKGPLE